MVTERADTTYTRPASDTPWPGLAGLTRTANGAQLAGNDRYWRDGRWHSHREDLRKAKWRKEQARKEAERRRQWERQHAHRHYR
ncbi:hypothetical protein FEM01_01525 [Pseudomonas mosselii]|uniref:Uncharacterized protein n=1 Tax=Pseudomonas mosselii TaxID=78327 RepID=A0A5R8ZKC8_9PSED|nr:hypothetical protein FEM01_01525 [Pseudomonas mosselii]